MYDLHFPEFGVTDYVTPTHHLTTWLRSLSICTWVRFTAVKKNEMMFIVSYGVHSTKYINLNELTFFVTEEGKIILSGLRTIKNLAVKSWL